MLNGKGAKQPDREIRVLGADDEEIVHWGLRFLLESQPWVERYVPAFTPAQTLKRAEQHRIDVAIVDVGLTGGQGLSTANALRHLRPSTRVLLLGGNDVAVGHAVAVGAAGMLAKHTAGFSLCEAVRLIAAGQRVFPAARQRDLNRLSARELEVLAAMAEGSTNREIAARLNLSPETVKQHTSAVYRKLGVRNRTEAARICEDPSGRISDVRQAAG